MRLRLVAVGQKMPAWVSAGVLDYSERLPREWKFELIELPLAQRGKNADLERARSSEGQKLIERTQETHRVVLDERGASWTSVELAARLQDWLQRGRDVSLLVGGPDGHAAEVMRLADERWSLSRLTLPHALVRVLIVEQLYRAWSLTTNHPYHRA